MSSKFYETRLPLLVSLLMKKGNAAEDEQVRYEFLGGVDSA